jgi:hypothetical protein
MQSHITVLNTYIEPRTTTEVLSLYLIVPYPEA